MIKIILLIFITLILVSCGNKKVITNFNNNPSGIGYSKIKQNKEDIKRQVNIFKYHDFLSLNMIDSGDIKIIKGNFLSNTGIVGKIEILSCKNNDSKDYDKYWYGLKQFQKRDNSFEYKISKSFNNYCDIPYYIKISDKYGNELSFVSFDIHNDKRKKIKLDYRKINNDFFYFEKNIYYKGKSLYDLDYKTFKVLGTYHIQDKNGIYYLRGLENNGFGIYNKINVDLNSFKPLNYGFGKDKNNYYFGNKKLNVDYNSFVILGKNYTKDKNGIYYKNGQYGGKRISTDFKYFKILSDYYAKDSKNIYINGLKSNGGNVNTFHVLKNGYARDGSKIFYKNNVNPIIYDVKDFKVLKYGYVIDSDKMYYKGNIVDGFLNDGKVKVYTKNYITDGTNIFFRFYTNSFDGSSEFNQFSRFDVKTFKVLGKNYVKDKNGIYGYGWRNKKEGIDDFLLLKNVDVNSFVLVNDLVAKDKNNYYKNGKVFKNNVDMANLGFKILKKYGNIYYKIDQLNNIIYYNNKNLGIHLNNLKYISLNYILGNKKGYYKGKDIKGLDINTFKIFKNGYAKDKNHVYINGVEQKNLDPHTFKYIGCNLSISNGKIYYSGKHLSEFLKVEKLVDLNNIKFEKRIDYGSFESDHRCIIADNKYMVIFKGFYKGTDDNDKLSLLFGQQVQKNNISIIFGFDYKTFSELSKCGNFAGRIECGYAKDKNHVYYNYHILTGADPNTFKVFPSYYGYDGKDKNNAYLKGKKLNNYRKYYGKLKLLSRFGNIVIDQGRAGVYTYDDKYVYLNNKLLTGLSTNIKRVYEGFSNEIFITDGKVVYRNSCKLNVKDPKTFNQIKVNGYDYYEDKYNIYRLSSCYYTGETPHIRIKKYGKVIKLKNGYWKDNIYLYNGLTKINIKGIDIKTFIIIDDYYAKDKNYIYQIKDSCDYSNIPKFIRLNGVDVKTFKVVGIFGKDKNGIYNIYVNINKNIDSKTFTFRNGVYQDKNNIYEYNIVNNPEDCERLKAGLQDKFTKEVLKFKKHK